MVETSDNQIQNKKPWLWKKGQSGNPAGRPKGKTMKEYAKEYIACLNDEERDAFMEEVGADMVWRMAEGNPKQETDITSAGKPLLSEEEKGKVKQALQSFIHDRGNT